MRRLVIEDARVGNGKMYGVNMRFIQKLVKGLLGKGFRIGWSSGKPFDPRNQERTDALSDIMKQDKKKEGE